MSLYVIAILFKIYRYRVNFNSHALFRNIFKRKFVYITHGDMCTMFMTAIEFDWMLKVKGIENFSNIFYVLSKLFCTYLLLICSSLMWLEAFMYTNFFVVVDKAAPRLKILKFELFGMLSFPSIIKYLISRTCLNFV